MRLLLVADRLDKDLTPGERRHLYEAMRHPSADARHVALGEIVLGLGKIDANLKMRPRCLDALP